MSDYSTFLFASPSFVEGASRMFDFGNTLSAYNVSNSGEDADNTALSLDSEIICRDLRQAFDVVKGKGRGARIEE